MELGKSIIDGINELANRDVFEKLVALSCQSLLDSKFPLDKHIQTLCCNVAAKGGTIESGIVKLVVRCAMSVLVEAARHGMDPAMLASYLEEHGVWEGAVTCLTRAYEERREELRLMLSHVNDCGGTALPHIVDVDWRMEYIVKTDTREKVNESVFLVNLQTDGDADVREAATNGGANNVEFACSSEQLQDLVGKLKDACKAVERAAASPHNK